MASLSQTVAEGQPCELRTPQSHSDAIESEGMVGGLDLGSPATSRWMVKISIVRGRCHKIIQHGSCLASSDFWKEHNPWMWVLSPREGKFLAPQRLRRNSGKALTAIYYARGQLRTIKNEGRQLMDKQKTKWIVNCTEF